MKKVSEVIKTLQSMQDAYGDLPVSIAVHFKKSELLTEDDNHVVSVDELYFGYDQFKEKSDEINIRSFPY